MSSKESTPKALSVKTNFIFNVAIQLLTYLIPLITAPHLSRTLTPAGVGSNSFVNSVATYFVLIITFGYTTYGTKEIAENRGNKKTYSNIFWNITFSRGFLFVFCFLAYFLMAYLWGFGSDVNKNIFLVYSLLLINAFLDITYLFQGLENFRILTILNIFFKAVAAILYFVFVKTADDLLLYTTIYASSTLLITLVSWAFAARWVSRPSFRNIRIFASLKNNLKYFLPAIAVSVYTILDRTMLGYISTHEEVGLYEEAYKIIAVGTGIVCAICPIILPRVSSLIKNGGEEEIRRKEMQVSELYFLMALPMMAGLYLVGRYFIPAFFGEDYTNSTYVLYWLTPLIVVIPISGIIGNIHYIPRNKISTTTIFITIGALVNFGANFLAIYYLGAQGAAITSLLAETIISTLYVIFSRKTVPYKDMLKKCIKPLIASAIMVAVLLPLELFVLDKYVANNLYITLVVVATGVIVYGVSIILLKEEMVMSVLRKIFKRKQDPTPKQEVPATEETNADIR